MANVSLDANIRTCKVDTAWGDKMYTDRFMNPNNMICPIWSGLDTAGRPSCANSFYTKIGGCHSSSDRINVENDQRPKYFNYITLDASGLQGPWDQDASCRLNDSRESARRTGTSGMVSTSQYIRSNCATCPKKLPQGPQPPSAGGQPRMFQSSNVNPISQEGYKGRSAYRRTKEPYRFVNAMGSPWM